MSERAGLVLITSAGARFVPGDVAERVATIGEPTAIPGLPLPAAGIAAAEGRVVTLVKVGDGKARIGVICDVDGDSIALVGAEIAAMGAFEATADGVVFGSEIVPELDVRALYAEIEGALWASRALRHARRRAEQRASDRPPPMRGGDR